MTPPNDDIESFNEEAELIRQMNERRRRLIATEREALVVNERVASSEDKAEEKRQVRRRAQREAREVGQREAETVGRQVKNLDLETAAIERNRRARERQAEVQKRQAIDFGRASRGGRDPLFSATYGRQEAGQPTSQHALRREFGIGGTRATTLQMALQAGLRPATGAQADRPITRVTAAELALGRSQADLADANRQLANANRRKATTDDERLALMQGREAARTRVDAAQAEFQAAQAAVIASRQRAERQRAETGLVVRDPAAARERRQAELQRTELGFIRQNYSHELELRDRESYERRRAAEAQIRRVEQAQRDLAGRPLAAGLHPDAAQRPGTALVPLGAGGGRPGTDIVLHNAARYQAQQAQEQAMLAREQRARLRQQKVNDIAGRPIGSGAHPDAADRGPGPDQNQARRSYTQTTVRMEAAERAAAAAAREQAVAFTTASNAMMRHGALSSEFILAAGRGEASLRDLGNQAVVTAGKFGGWLAAGSAIYLLGDAVRSVGEGALQASSGVDQLARVTAVTDRRGASQGFAQLAQEFNVPVETAAQAVYLMGQRFHDQDDAQQAARASLAAVVAGEMDLQQASSGLIAVTQAYNLSAEDTMRVIDQANAAQNRYGATIPDIVTGLARAGGAWTNAGGDLEYLQALMVTIQRETKETGSTIGTGFVRGVNAFRSESGKAALEAEGVRVNVNSMQETIQSAFEAVERGGDPNAIAKGLFGPHYYRLMAGVLKDQENFQKIMADTTGQDATGSAMEEVRQVMKEAREEIKQVGINLQALGEALSSAGAFAMLGVGLHTLNEILEITVSLVNVFNELPGPIAQAVMLLGQGYLLMRGMQRFGLTDRLAGGPLGFMAAPDRTLQRQARSGLRGRAEAEQQRYESAQQRAYGAGADYETRTRMAREYSQSSNYRRALSIPDDASEADIARRTRAMNTMASLEDESRQAGHRLTQANLESASARESAVRAERQFNRVSQLHHREVRNFLETERIAIPNEMGRPSTAGTSVLPGDVSRARRAGEGAAQSYGRRSAQVVQALDNAMIDALGRPGGPVDQAWGGTPNGGPMRRMRQRLAARRSMPRLPRDDGDAYRAWQDRADEENRRRMSLDAEQRRQEDIRRGGAGGRQGGMVPIFDTNVDRDANRTTLQAKNTQRDLSRSTRALRGTTVALGGVASGLGRARGGLMGLGTGLANMVRGLGPIDGALIAIAGTMWAVDAMKEREREADDFEKESMRIGASAEARARNLEKSDKKAEGPGWFETLMTANDSLIGNALYATRQREREQARANIEFERQRQEFIREAEAKGTARPMMNAEDLSGDIERDTQLMRAGLISKQEFEANLERYAREAKMLNFPSRQQLQGVQQSLADARRDQAGESYTDALRNMSGEQVAGEQKVTLSRMQAFGSTPGLLRQAQRQYEDAIRRYAGGDEADTQKNIEALDQARQAYFQIVAQSAQQEMQRDLGLAESGPDREAVFDRAQERLTTQVRASRETLRKSQQAEDQKQKAYAQARAERERAEADRGVGRGATDPITGMPRVMGGDGADHDMAELKRREQEAKAAVEAAKKTRNRNEEELQALLRTEDEIQQAITDARRQDRRSRRQSILSYRQVQERDPVEDAKLAIDTARRNQRDDLQDYGRDSDEYRESTVELFTARQQLAQAVRASVDAENAMILAQAGTDPVSQARAGTQGAQNTLRAMLQHEADFSPDEITSARAALMQAQRQEGETVQEQASRLAELQGRIAVARAGDDPVAAARAAQRVASRAMRDADDPVERAEALLASIEANNDLEEALSERESARGRWLASKNDDPVAAARAERKEAERAVKRAPKGSTEWYEAQTRLNEARRAEVQSELDETTATIEFEREMGNLSVGDAIARYQTLLESRNWSKQQKREIQRRIKALQDESAQEASGFNLNVGDLKLPTAYDVRKAFDPVRETVRRQVREATRTVTGEVDDPVRTGRVNVKGRRASVYNDVSESVSNMYDQRAQVQAQVNVYVSDRGAVSEVYEALDRVLGTSVRAKARAAGRR